jgi:hypothetical protein
VVQGGGRQAPDGAPTRKIPRGENSGDRPSARTFRRSLLNHRLNGPDARSRRLCEAPKASDGPLIVGPPGDTRAIEALIQPGRVLPLSLPKLVAHLVHGAPPPLPHHPGTTPCLSGVPLSAKRAQFITLSDRIFNNILQPWYTSRAQSLAIYSIVRLSLDNRPDLTIKEGILEARAPL